MNNDDFEYIMKFNKIQLNKILKKLRIDKSNFYNKRIKPEKVKLIRKHVESEIAKLYVIDDGGE